MSDFDQNLRDALVQDNAHTTDDEANALELVAESFRGRNRWLNICAVLVTLVVVVSAILAAVQFFQVSAVRDLLLWATTFVSCLVALTMMKVWFWMEMQRHALAREIKRLELQVAQLAARWRP